MEAWRRSKQWQVPSPDLNLTSRTTEETERCMMEVDGIRRGRQKTVTMAPTSKVLTDGNYITRKPVFSTEHLSILKTTPPENQNAKEKMLFTGRRKDDLNFQTKPREDLIQQSFSSLSVCGEGLRPPLGVSQLTDTLSHEESTFASLCLGSDTTHQSFSSSVFDVQRLNPLLRPRLTSTGLYPTPTTCTHNSRHGKRDVGGRAECGHLAETASVKPSKGPSTSSFQTSYWACAVPSGLPPSPDRNSAAWDPNKEYQALLDYTYPLRPGLGVGGGEGSDPSEPTSQDSGIDLCSSTSLSGLDLSLCSTGQRREKGKLGVERRSCDLQGLSKSPGCLALTNPDEFSFDGLDQEDLNHCTRRDNELRDNGLLSTAAVGPTRILHQSRSPGGDVDEEFWPLPDQLEELQVLPRQVKEVADKLNQPVSVNWNSLEPGITLFLSAGPQPDQQVTSQHDPDPQKTWASAQVCSSGDQGDFETAKRTDSAGGGCVPHSRLREALVQQLSSLTEDREQTDTLLQHIQVFCLNLDKLIQWLYVTLEKKKLLLPAAVDISRDKSSLAEYQRFQSEVSSLQPLTSCVLQTGHLLLSCMNSACPLLRDALVHIERQSRALDNHREHFVSSMLPAVDTLTHPVHPLQKH